MDLQIVSGVTRLFRAKFAAQVGLAKKGMEMRIGNVIRRRRFEPIYFRLRVEREETRV